MSAQEPDNSPKPVFSPEFRRDLETLLLWRRDVRRFKTDPVPEDLLTNLLELADLAPSVGNSQPWRIVSVESAGRREAIARSFEAEKAAAGEAYEDDKAQIYRDLKLAGLKDAPVHLAIFSDNNPDQGHGLGRMTMPETLAYSTVGMINTLWLVARANGIGLGWVSILDPAVVHQVLDVDPDWQFVGYLCVGYPEEEHIDPELERFRWQERSSLDGRLFRR